MTGSDNGYYGDKPEMTFEKLVNTPPTTDFEAMRMALVLYIVAPDDQDLGELWGHVQQLTVALTKDEIEAAKAAALLIVKGMDNEG